MSSMVSRFVLATALLAGVSPGMAQNMDARTATYGGAAGQAPQPQSSPPSSAGLMVQPIPGAQQGPQTGQAQTGQAQIGQATQPTPWQRVQQQFSYQQAGDAETSAAIANWRRLAQGDNYGFSDYAAFLLANPGWPGEERMRRVAEGRIDPNSFEPGQVISYFTRFPPLTATGQARYAVALAALNRNEEAKAAARRAWAGGVLPADDEQRLLSRFSGVFTTADYDQRADMLLWVGANAAAERILAYASPARRPVFEARIAIQRKAPDAAMKVAAAEGLGATDAGFLGEKAMWLRDSGDSVAARALLANRQPLANRPANAEKWFEAMLTNAKAAANDSQWPLAYAIASKVDDAYPAGTDVRDRPIGERDDYTSLTWLAGYTAYYNLNRPQDAMGMFIRYAQGARSPQTISKGYYWAGRAALAAGDKAGADQYFARAGAFPDQFYGQLALERMGRPIPVPGDVDRPIQVSAAERKAFMDRGAVRAAIFLGRQGLWEDQTRFIRAIAASAETDRDHLLTAELARQIGRPDLGVMVGRRATADGLTGYGEASFPRIPVPDSEQPNWTMVHAIARQESQFDRSAVSHAGARGLMQLMPRTAAATAGRIGLSYSTGSLTDDTGYNIQLGSNYFQQMLNYYAGSYPLAIAAYNAGPGNVNRWIDAKGDPRLAGADVLKWVEDIPIYETRNYVQRVLENAVVYDLMNPNKARFQSKAPLSRYLGKNQPG